jgi:hypothetical protein
MLHFSDWKCQKEKWKHKRIKNEKQMKHCDRKNIDVLLVTQV